MPSKAGHLVKLIPVAIGGTYASSPGLLPTPPKDMEMLLEERACYIVTTVRNEKTKNTEYLLACRIKEFDQSLDFFFYSPSSTVKKSTSKGTAIPVRYLNDLGGAKETRKKALT